MTWSRSALVAAALALAGCEHLSVRDLVVLPLSADAKPPTQLAMTVQPCWLAGEKKVEYSGVYCRMYFFDEKDPAALLANGDLTVVAYDEDADLDPNQPHGLYRVGADEMAGHYRKDVVGHSYVFWFHYQTDKPVNLRIQARFKPAAGEEIVSQWVRTKLDPASKESPPQPPVHSTESAVPPSQS